MGIKLCDLTLDILTEILIRLRPVDIKNYIRTCHILSLTLCDSVWHRLHQRHFSVKWWTCSPTSGQSLLHNDLIRESYVRNMHMQQGLYRDSCVKRLLDSSSHSIIAVTSVISYSNASRPQLVVIGGSDNGSVLLWSLDVEHNLTPTTGYQSRLGVHVGPISCCVAAPINNEHESILFFTGSQDCSISILRAMLHSEDITELGHIWDPKPIFCIDYIDNIVAFGTWSNAKCRDVETGSLLCLLEGHRGAVFSIKNIKNNMFITASADGTVRAWDIRVPEQPDVHIMSGCHKDSVYALDYHSHRSHEIVSGSRDGVVAIWDLRFIKQPVIVNQVDSGCIEALQFLENDIITGSRNGTINIFNFDRCHSYCEFVGTISFPGQSDWGWIRSMCSTRNKSILACASQSGVCVVSF